MVETMVMIKGSDDWAPPVRGRTDTSGAATFILDEPGYVEVIVGETPPTQENCGFGQSKEPLIGLMVDESATVKSTAQGDGFVLEAEGAEVWPVQAVHRRYLEYLQPLMDLARMKEPDENALAALVDKQRAEIMADPNLRFRKIMAIEHATCVAQMIGPEPILRLREWIPFDDPAWIPKSGYLQEMFWGLGENAGEFMDALAEQQRDPGVLAAILSWRIVQANTAGDEAAVKRLYREISDPRFRHTSGFRNVRRFNPDRALRLGAQLPGFSALRLDKEGTITQEELKGKVWAINVWSSWCKPCLEELDELPELYRRLRADGVDVEFLSISTDGERGACERELEKRGLPWALAWAEKSEELKRAWGFSGVPLTVLIDAQGKIVNTWDTATSIETIEMSIRDAVTSDRKE